MWYVAPDRNEIHWNSSFIQTNTQVNSWYTFHIFNGNLFYAIYYHTFAWTKIKCYLVCKCSRERSSKLVYYVTNKYENNIFVCYQIQRFLSLVGLNAGQWYWPKCGYLWYAGNVFAHFNEFKNMMNRWFDEPWRYFIFHLRQIFPFHSIAIINFPNKWNNNNNNIQLNCCPAAQSYWFWYKVKWWKPTLANIRMDQFIPLQKRIANSAKFQIWTTNNNNEWNEKPIKQSWSALSWCEVLPSI